jgi:hypothetical protein
VEENSVDTRFGDQVVVIKHEDGRLQELQTRLRQRVGILVDRQLLNG